MVNKKAQDLSLTTIILIVLGIVVLVLLVWGFSTGWGNLWDKVNNYFGGGNNADSIRSGCELACSTLSVNDFCTNARTLKLDVKKIVGSCYNFAEDSNLAGVVKCSEVSCTSANTYNQTCEDLSGKWESKCVDGYEDKIAKVKSDTRDEAGKTKNLVCCVKK